MFENLSFLETIVSILDIRGCPDMQSAAELRPRILAEYPTDFPSYMIVNFKQYDDESLNYVLRPREGLFFIMFL